MHFRRNEDGCMLRNKSSILILIFRETEIVQLMTTRITECMDNSTESMRKLRNETFSIPFSSYLQHTILGYCYPWHPSSRAVALHGRPPLRFLEHRLPLICFTPCFLRSIYSDLVTSMQLMMVYACFQYVEILSYGTTLSPHRNLPWRLRDSSRN